MKPFNHHNARSVGEATRLLKSYGGKAVLNAGGTDILSVLKDKILLQYPEAVINIKTIPGLDYIKEDAKGLKIGAMARLEQIAVSPVIHEKYRILSEGAQSVATPQVRRMGTIGGNLCQDVRCWYYRYPHFVGGRISCYLKGGKSCYAQTRENQYHSIFGGMREQDTPCQVACPGHVRIPECLEKIREGDLNAAARILLTNNPIPSITGRVCPHFCQQLCNRSEYDAAVSFRNIERFVGDYIIDHADEIYKAPEIETGKSVAVMGSGPAGLSAAYYLRIAGHKVTVYDRMPEAGGILMYVIPEYRLPKDIVRWVVKSFTKIGVEFKLKSDVGKDISLDELKRSYDSVFISTGAWNPVSIGLKGEESARFGMEFLTEIGLGAVKAPGEKVLVIGGGNAAIDVAVSALRLGAKEATLACLECREEMPAHPWEIEQAVEEGVRIMPSWGPQKIITSAGKVTGLELVKCTSVYDSKRCFAPSYDKNTTEIVNADTIMMAVGYSTDLGFLGEEIPVKVNRGLIVADTKNQETNIPGIYAGGTVVLGPVAAIEAIASGKRAAAAITSYLTDSVDTPKTGKSPKPLLKFNSSFLEKTKPVTMPVQSVGQRKIDIEDNLGLSSGQAHEEANRCFNCSCLSINPSDLGLVLVALGAKIKIIGTDGTRTVQAEEFFDSVKSRLASDEMVVEIQVPKQPDKARQTFTKFRLRNSVDFPMVSLASIISVENDVCRGARIVLGAVAPRPFRMKSAERLLINKPINEETVRAASEALAQETIPLNKNAYKIKIMKTLVKRALLDQK